MKKYGLRLLVGLAALTVGLAAFYLWEFSQFRFGKKVEFKSDYTQPLDFPAAKNFEDGIEIRFDGVGRVKKTPTLIFEIINHNDFPVKYSSFQEKTFGFTFVKFNGREKYEWRCGTGLQEFTLGAGESLKNEVQADYQIIEFLNLRGYFQFGFFLKTKEKEGKQYWSQPLTISEELKKDIIKNASSFLKERSGKPGQPNPYIQYRD